MRTVLYINLDFPPMSGPGIWRALGFVKYLPQYGHRTIVLCSDRSPARDRYDDSLLAEIPPGTEVHRIPSWFQNDLARPIGAAADAIPVKRIASLVRKVQHRLVREYPDQQVHWAMKAAARGAWIAARRKPDCVITSGPPHIAHVAGLFIKRTTGLPWLMDYRDLWTDDRVQIKQTSYQQRLFEPLEAEAVRRSDGVLAVSPFYIEHLSQRFRGSKSHERWFLIRNGHDLPEETIDRSLVLPKNDRPHFHFNGTPQVTHPFGRILDVLDRLRAGGRRLPLFTFTGMPPKFDEEVRRRGFEDSVRDVGHMSRMDSVDYSMKCDVLLAMVNAANPLYRGTIPGKAYEAIALGRHLLAILPKGSTVASLIEDSRNGTLVDVDDLDDIHRGVVRILDLFDAGKLNADQDPVRRRALAARYSRRKQTQELVEVLDEVLGR